jgi:hypothetical protein
MTVLFDANDHSNLSIDIDSVVSVPPSENLVRDAAQPPSGGLKGCLWPPAATPDALPIGPGSVVTGDQTELLARLSDLAERRG